MQAASSHAANECDVVMEVLLHSQRTASPRGGAGHRVNRLSEKDWRGARLKTVSGGAGSERDGFDGNLGTDVLELEVRGAVRAVRRREERCKRETLGARCVLTGGS